MCNTQGNPPRTHTPPKIPHLHTIFFSPTIIPISLDLIGFDLTELQMAQMKIFQTTTKPEIEDEFLMSLLINKITNMQRKGKERRGKQNKEEEKF